MRPFFLFAAFAGHPSSSPFLGTFLPVLPLEKCSVLQSKGRSTELGEWRFHDGPLHKVREGDQNSLPFLNVRLPGRFEEKIHKSFSGERAKYTHCV